MPKIPPHFPRSSSTPVAVANVGVVAVGAQVDGSLSSWLAANTNGIYLCGSGRW